MRVSRMFTGRDRCELPSLVSRRAGRGRLLMWTQSAHSELQGPACTLAPTSAPCTIGEGLNIEEKYGVPLDSDRRLTETMRLDQRDMMTTRGGVWSGGHGPRLTCPHQARRAEETMILMSFPRPAAVLDLLPGPRLKSHAWSCTMNSPHLIKLCAHRATGTNSRRALFSSRHGTTSVSTKERSPNNKPLFRGSN
jgi:hypothetical protein